MKKLVTICVVAAMALVACGVAQAAVDVSYVVTPADLADGPTFNNGRGGDPSAMILIV